MRKMIENYKRWNPNKYSILLLLLIPSFVYFLLKFKVNNDFWFIVNTGKEIVKNGFVRVEPFTIHQGFSYISQQWATSVLFYLIFRYFGAKGMYVFMLFANMIIVYLMYKLSMVVSNNKKKLSIFVTVICDFFLLFLNIFITRPQIFDIIITISQLYVLELYIKDKNNKYLYFLPLFAILQINLHASTFFMFFACLVPYFVEIIYNKIIKKENIPLKPLLIITILSFLVGIINPYGIDAITYIFNSYGRSDVNSAITEMLPTNLYNGMCIYLFIFISLYSFYYNKGKNKIRYFLLFLGMLLLTLMHIRGNIYFLSIMPIIICYNLKKDSKELLPIQILFKEKIIYISLIVIIIFIILLKGVNNDMIEPKIYKLFGDYLDENTDKNIKLYTGYNPGGYFEYRGYKCYIDPRAEVFFEKNNKKEDIYNEYTSLMYGDIEAKDFLDKYNFDYLIVQPTEKWLYNEVKENEEYELVYKGENDKLFLYKKK